MHPAGRCISDDEYVDSEVDQERFLEAMRCFSSRSRSVTARQLPDSDRFIVMPWTLSRPLASSEHVAKRSCGTGESAFITQGCSSASMPVRSAYGRTCDLGMSDPGGGGNGKRPVRSTQYVTARLN